MKFNILQIKRSPYLKLYMWITEHKLATNFHTLGTQVFLVTDAHKKYTQKLAQSHRENYQISIYFLQWYDHTQQEHIKWTKGSVKYSRLAMSSYVKNHKMINNQNWENASWFGSWMVKNHEQHPVITKCKVAAFIGAYYKLSDSIVYNNHHWFAKPWNKHTIDPNEDWQAKHTNAGIEKKELPSVQA